METDIDIDTPLDEESSLTSEYTLQDSITYTLVAIHVIIVGVSVIGNITIVASFFVKGGRKTNANCYIIAVAISDFLFIIFSEPFTIFSNLVNFHWIFGSFMCSVVGFTQTSSVIQRSFLLVASCLDRYRAIRWPLKKPTSRKAVIYSILAIWIASLTLPVPVALFSQLVVFDNGGNGSVMCIEIWPTDDFRKGFSISLLLLTYILPLTILTVTFRLIALILQKKPPGEEYAGLLKRQRDRKKRMIQIFLCTFFAYAICWLPIHLITIVGEMSPQIYNSKVVHVFWLSAQCLAVSNAAINPVIVLSRERKYRAQLHVKQSSFAKSRRESNLTYRNSFRQRSYSAIPISKSSGRAPSYVTSNLTSRYSYPLPKRRRQSEPVVAFKSRLRRSSTQDTCV